MTVRELIEELSKLDGEMPVMMPDRCSEEGCGEDSVDIQGVSLYQLGSLSKPEAHIY